MSGLDSGTRNVSISFMSDSVKLAQGLIVLMVNNDIVLLELNFYRFMVISGCAGNFTIEESQLNRLKGLLLAKGYGFYCRRDTLTVYL